MFSLSTVSRLVFCKKNRINIHHTSMERLVLLRSSGFLRRRKMGKYYKIKREKGSKVQVQNLGLN